MLAPVMSAIISPSEKSRKGMQHLCINSDPIPKASAHKKMMKKMTRSFLKGIFLAL